MSSNHHYVLVIILLIVGFIAVPAHAALPLTTWVPAGQASTVGSFTVSHGTQRYVATPAQVKTWFKTSNNQLQLRPSAIYDWLNVQVSPQVNQPGESSRFVRQGSVVQMVGSGTKGKIVDGLQTSLAIRSALVAGRTTAPLVMKVDRPDIFSLDDFKRLAFPDHLAHGETNFAGSPANRVHNIKVATARYDGLVVMPDKTFSFNQYLGVIDATHGYKPELVIKEHVTTPEFGGGICQVATTMFRAAMPAGVHITNRHNHSYPVAYYGAPGFDATVYPPYTDLTFVNDTGQPLYIRTSIVGSRLLVDFYGTANGRKVTVNGPFVTDRYPNGNITAAVAQIVTKAGKRIREQNFVSHYQSADKFPIVRAANGG